MDFLVVKLLRKHCNTFKSLFKELKVKEQKRFYSRGTLRSIRISRLAKIPTLYRDWLGSLNLKEGVII